NNTLGTARGIVAATSVGQPLFYRLVTPYTTRIITYHTSEDATEQQQSANTTTGTPFVATALSSYDTITNVSNTQETNETSQITTYYTTTDYNYYTYQYFPCYYEQRSYWKDTANAALYIYSDSNNPTAYTGIDLDKVYANEDNMNQMTAAQRNTAAFAAEDPKFTTQNANQLVQASVRYISSQYATTSTVNNVVTYSIHNDSSSANPKGAFSDNGNLVSLTIPSSIQGIGNYAFYGCTALQTITFSDAIKVIGFSAFENCTSLNTVNLGAAANIDTIGQRCFKDDRMLTSFTVPIKVATICDQAFMGCTALNNFDFSQTNQNVVLGQEVFRGCTALQNMTLPQYLSNVGVGTFKECTNLMTVDFPSTFSNNSVPISIFQSCTGLRRITCNNASTKFVGVPAATAGGYHYDIHSFIEDYSADNVDDFYFEGYSSSGIHDLCTDNSIAFKYLDQDLYEKVIKDNSDHRFTYQVNSDNVLVNVTITNSTGGAASGTFDLDIPDGIGPYGIATIGSRFQGNTQIESVVIPQTVSTIESGAFKGCYNLEKVTFETDTVAIGEDAFNTQEYTPNNASASTITAPDLHLQFVGTISSSATPFLYAMDPGSNINNTNQPTTYIDFFSGSPSLLHVMYDPDTDKNNLYKIPVYADVDNPPDTDSDYYKAIDQGLTDSGLDSTYQSPLEAVQAYEAGASLPENLYNIIDSAYNIVMPTGIESFTPELFSDAASHSQDVTKHGSGYAPISAYTTSGVTANTKIKSIVMNDIEEIPEYAFYGCSVYDSTAPNSYKGLESVKMYGSGNANGEKIGDYAFGHCKALTSAILPQSTSEMGLRPFACAENLTAVTFTTDPTTGVAESNNSLGTNFECEAGIIYGLNEAGARDSVVECLETRCGTGTNSIGSSTVSSEELAGITSLAPEAFMNVPGIGKVDLSTSKIRVVPEYAFACDENHTSTMNEVLIPMTATTIDDYAFLNSSVKQLTIPSTVSIFDNSAFASDTSTIIRNVTVSTSEGSPAAALVENYSSYNWNLGDAIKAVYTVSFYDYDGTTLLDEQSVIEGEDAVPPTTPDHSAEGLQFSKWDRDYTSVSRDMMIVAIYEEIPETTWTVTFYDWDLTVLATRTVPNGGNAEEPKSPTRTDYTFTGWTKPFTNVTSNVDTMAVYTYSGAGSNTSGNNSSNTSGNNSSSSSSNNATLYTLTVINGSGSGSYAAGTTVVVAANAPLAGYTFTSWAASATNVEFASPVMSATTFVMPASNLTVTALYTGVSSNNVTPNNVSPNNIIIYRNGGSTSGNNATRTSNKNRTSVHILKPGISNSDLASATVTGSTDNFVVTISEDADATLQVANALKKEYGSLDTIKYFAFDLSLYDSTGTTKITDTTGLAVTVTIPIPDELVPYMGNNKVAGVVAGSLDRLNPQFSTIDGVPCVTFTATHFSPYTVYVDTANLSSGISDSSPKTGDLLQPKWFLALGLALLSIVLFLKKDRRSSNIAVA
ncbi:MAG: leucine-rich repeat protein, partial [Lachnospiraceae bacterium]|nr:leucine-rich repeat protein [Lachnospiraceae bacterium]